MRKTVSTRRKETNDKWRTTNIFEQNKFEQLAMLIYIYAQSTILNGDEDITRRYMT